MLLVSNGLLRINDLFKKKNKYDKMKNAVFLERSDHCDLDY